MSISDKYKNIIMLTESNKYHLKSQLYMTSYLLETIDSICDLTYGPKITKKNRDNNYDIIMKIDYSSLSTIYNDVLLREAPYYATASYVVIQSNRENLLLTEYLYYYLKYIDIDPNIDINDIEIKIPTIEIQKTIISYCGNNDVIIDKLKKYIEENETLLDKVNLFIMDVVKKVKIID